MMMWPGRRPGRGQSPAWYPCPPTHWPGAAGVRRPAHSRRWGRTGDGGDQHAVLPDAVGGLHHGIVILDFEGVVLERVQLGQGNFQNLLPLGVRPAFLGGKQVIDRGQLYSFRAAFQVSTPPLSDSCRLSATLPPGSWAKILCPRRWSLWPDRVGDLGAEHLDFAAVGLPQQSGDLSGKVGAVVHHRQQDAVDLELGVQLPLDLVMVDSSCSRPLAGRYSAWTGTMILWRRPAR